MKLHSNADGVLIENPEYDRKEAYVCSNPSCNARIYRQCFNDHPTDSTTTIVECHNSQEQAVDNEDCIGETEEEEEADDNQMSAEQEEDRSIGDDSSAGGTFLLASGLDPTLDITQDNHREPVGFMSTNAGDIPLNVEQSTKGDSVSGHVISNRLGNCVSRRHGDILGTSRQKH